MDLKKFQSARILNYEIPDSIFVWMQVLISLLFCLLPLFMNLTFRSNIFLTWEGSYRLIGGQIPYKDFGIPMGIGFWLTPALFFKMFGPYMGNLINAQIFLNLISLISIRVIFKKLELNEAAILLIILVNCVTFVYINVWPWYNHTVYVFQLVSIMFLVLYLTGENRKYQFIYLGLCTLFSVLAFFTKQDGGAFSILINGIIMSTSIIAFKPKRIYDIGLFTFLISILLAGYIFLFKNYDFSYWFNYGQFPHYSRVNIWDIINKFFGGSMFLKFYLVFGIVAVLYFISSGPVVKFNQSIFLVVTICLLILSQVIIIQVTSFSPATGILYFHTFGIALILFLLKLPLKRVGIFLITFLSLMLVFSDSYWPTAQGKIRNLLPASFVNKNHEVVSLNTWAPAVTNSLAPPEMVKSEIPILSGLKITEQTVTGVNNIMNLPIFLEKQSEVRVLNMSELTFLAHEMKYSLLSGPGVPLWYHKGVSLFDREIDFLCDLIENKKFDIILFEQMNYVEDFFPYAVRECAIENYTKVLEFEGPTPAHNIIEVYVLSD